MNNRNPLNLVVGTRLIDKDGWVSTRGGTVIVTQVNEDGTFWATAEGSNIVKQGCGNGEQWYALDLRKVEKDNSRNNPLDGRAYRASRSSALRRVGTIKTLIEKGYSQRKIAAKLGLSKSAVGRVALIANAGYHASL